jgi:hypothetical protein
MRYLLDETVFIQHGKQTSLRAFKKNKNLPPSELTPRRCQILHTGKIILVKAQER